MKCRFMFMAFAYAMTTIWASVSSGVIITEYDLQTNAGDEVSEPPATSAAGVSGAPITRGAGIGATTTAGSMNSNGWDGTAADEYFSFGFTVSPGFEVDLTDLRIGTRSSGTGPGMIGLYYSGDSFAVALATFDQSPGGNFVNSIVDLSALDGLTGFVEFRLLEIGNTQADGVGTTASGGTLRVTEYFNVTSQNLTINGDVIAIPEPSSLCLIGLASVGLIAIRRRFGS